ncbi:hypothetical protein [Streptomyces sp. NPDC052042]|uniref:hypothetical protein n=1 Tax=Streptomyces sp. NPDC052042 TaxID=3365683 RepID=UPI0037D7A0AE
MVTATAAVAVSLLLLTGCGKATGYHDATGGESGTPSPSPSVNPSYGTRYLDFDACAAPEGDKQLEDYREVPCDTPEAIAKVIYRTDSGSAVPFSATSCAARTDFVVDVPLSLAALEHTRQTVYGYACAQSEAAAPRRPRRRRRPQDRDRRLRAQHPGEEG